MKLDVAHQALTYYVLSFVEVHKSENEKLNKRENTKNEPNPSTGIYSLVLPLIIKLLDQKKTLAI